MFEIRRKNIKSRYRFFWVYQTFVLIDKISDLKSIFLEYKLTSKMFKKIFSLEIDINRLSEKYKRLSIVVNYLKNPNIINIKRKLVEVVIFNIYAENSHYFEISFDYYPQKFNLECLEQLIHNKKKVKKTKKKLIKFNKI